MTESGVDWNRAYEAYMEAFDNCDEPDHKAARIAGLKAAAPFLGERQDERDLLWQEHIRKQIDNTRMNGWGSTREFIKNLRERLTANPKPESQPQTRTEPANENQIDVRMVRPVDRSVLGSKQENFVPLPITDDRGTDWAEIAQPERTEEMKVSEKVEAALSGANEVTRDIRNQEAATGYCIDCHRQQEFCICKQRAAGFVSSPAAPQPPAPDALVSEMCEIFFQKHDPGWKNNHETRGIQLIHGDMERVLSYVWGVVEAEMLKEISIGEWGIARRLQKHVNGLECANFVLERRRTKAPEQRVVMVTGAGLQTLIDNCQHDVTRFCLLELQQLRDAARKKGSDGHTTT